MGELYGVDEFVVVTITHDFAARVRSYELLAEAFGVADPSLGQAALTPRPPLPILGEGEVRADLG